MNKKDNSKKKAAQQAAKQKRHFNHTDNSVFSQRLKILGWFKNNPSLATEQARRELGIMHPAGRIGELRKRGYNILTHWADYPTADGSFHRMAKYVLMSRKGGEDE
mgnify:CR=1 FL=1